MKQGYWKGFFTGTLLAVLMLGIGFSALAVSRTIQVEDGVQVTINGARFIPRDVNGNEVSVFAYNGTTYAPIRAVCEAAGLMVDYKDGTAQVTTVEVALAADPNRASYITAEKAREIALDHAGVKADEAVFLKTKLERDDGRMEYDVEFYCGSVEYDYDLDALTGAVLKYGHDLDNYDIYYHDQGHHKDPGAVTQDDLITAEAAKTIALGQASQGARVVKCKLDWDDGRYVYEIEMRDGLTEYECEVNALTGVILDWDVDHNG